MIRSPVTRILVFVLAVCQYYRGIITHYVGEMLCFDSMFYIIRSHMTEFKCEIGKKSLE